MNGFVDDLLVGLVLLAGFGYATYALGPRTLRSRMALGMSALLNKLPAFVGLRGTAQRLAASAAKAQGSCGGCDNCGSTPAPTQSSADVSIPVSSIGKRPN